MSPTAKTFWWIRHAPTHAKTMIGWSDLPGDLSDAAALMRLERALPREASIVSSDLSRTRVTADAVAGKRQRLTDRPMLREINFGSWENRSFAEIEAEDPHRIRSFWETPGDVRAPSGESWNELRQRVDAAVDELLTLSSEHVIVVAHFGVILSQVARALGITPSQAFGQKIDNLSVTRLVFDGAWRAEVINQRH